MSVLPILAVKCHYCSRHVRPDECLHIGSDAAMCWRCYEWHNKALMALAGQPPDACQECGRTYGEMEDGAGDVRMGIHQKDGIYQVLCMACSDNYVRKRRDLYGPTMFGHRMGLN